jgi:hypothetical protein
MLSTVSLTIRKPDGDVLSGVSISARVGNSTTEATSDSDGLVSYSIVAGSRVRFGCDSCKALDGLTVTVPQNATYSVGTFITDPISEVEAVGISLLSSTVVDTDVGTKQALYTVPVGKACVITSVAARSPSASLAAIEDPATLGFNAPATDCGQFAAADLSALTDTTVSILFLSTAAIGSVAVGSAGSVFGIIIFPSADATVTIDVFGYLISV